MCFKLCCLSAFLLLRQMKPIPLGRQLLSPSTNIIFRWSVISVISEIYQANNRSSLKHYIFRWPVQCSAVQCSWGFLANSVVIHLLVDWVILCETIFKNALISNSLSYRPACCTDWQKELLVLPWEGVGGGCGGRVEWRKNGIYLFLPKYFYNSWKSLD